jgi:hypothetical protein
VFDVACDFGFTKAAQVITHLYPLHNRLKRLETQLAAQLRLPDQDEAKGRQRVHVKIHHYADIGISGESPD